MTYASTIVNTYGRRMRSAGDPPPSSEGIVVTPVPSATTTTIPPTVAPVAVVPVPSTVLRTTYDEQVAKFNSVKKSAPFVLVGVGFAGFMLGKLL